MKPRARCTPLVLAGVLLLWGAWSHESFACQGQDKTCREAEVQAEAKAEEALSSLSRRAILAAPAALAQPAAAEDSKTEFKRLREIQYIAALGDPKANSGGGAESWGLWRKDPGPRGVRLYEYDKLKFRGGVAPAKWQFDDNDWWLEEHGLIMEKPDFPLPAGKYLVTGAREVTTSLTVSENGTWQLGDGAKLYDVTHLPCRSARYTPASGATCKPTQDLELQFPVVPGAVMPPQAGCNKQDYAVLFVIGVAA
ncbi:unnamed protein product [Effrenium voratum]|nr:unnamed protein product [Effrenium voratum]